MVKPTTKAQNSKVKTKTGKRASMGSEKLKAMKKAEDGRRRGAQPVWNAIQAAVLNDEMFNFTQLLIKKRFTGGSRRITLTKGQTVNEYIDTRVDTLFAKPAFVTAVPMGLTLQDFRNVSIMATVFLVFVDLA
jgi:hypothetical protein